MHLVVIIKKIYCFNCLSYLSNGTDKCIFLKLFAHFSQTTTTKYIHVLLDSDVMGGALSRKQT